MKQLSVIIVNYNVKHFLEQCLISVFKALEGIDSEVWVVDNNSVDGSMQMVREKFPRVNRIENKDNPGFSKANNQAIRESDAEYVLLLNPDTVVEEQTFHKCLKFMEDHADAGALGVKMIDGDGHYLPESKRGMPTPWVAFYRIFGLSKIFPKSKKFNHYHLGYLDKDENHEVDVLSGAFMLMRKECLDKIGLLDETFFMYGEDIDLSYRVTLGGYKNYYFSDTKIIHYKGESTKKGSLNYVRVFYNAMIIFARKHFSGGYQKLFIFLIQLAVYFRALIAVFNRLVQKAAFPVIEGALIYASIYGIKEYWEFRANYIKGEEGQYPWTFDLIAAPIYTLTFLFFLWFMGAYKKPFRIKPIFTSAFSSFIAIATITYMLKEINFSRAIVGLSSFATIIIAVVTRGLINLKEQGKFFFTEEVKRRGIIVGNVSESEKIKKMIRSELVYPVDIEGTVVLDENSPKSEEALGTLDQLREIISFYRINEVIFSNKNIPTLEIINIMAGLQIEGVKYKIIPPDADYLIGSHAIYSSVYNGSFFNLDKKEFRFQKRMFDVMSSLLMLLTYPLHFWLYKKPGLALKNIWNVFRGEYHLVGYISQNPQGLPEIKKGFLNMLDRVKAKTESKGKHSTGLDRLYARSWTLELDIEILFKGFRKLGEVRE